jgi:hypothetical protein
MLYRINPPNFRNDTVTKKYVLFSAPPKESDFMSACPGVLQKKKYLYAVKGILGYFLLDSIEIFILNCGNTVLKIPLSSLLT